MTFACNLDFQSMYGIIPYVHTESTANEISSASQTSDSAGEPGLLGLLEASGGRPARRRSGPSRHPQMPDIALLSRKTPPMPDKIYRTTPPKNSSRATHL